MNVSGIIKSSLIDFPGMISCVLFVPGCNYNCFFCHNRALIDGSHILLTPQYVTEFLQRRAGLLDGAVVSGGEPTLQSGLIPFLQTIKGFGYKIKLDTNGSRPEVIRKLLSLQLCDYYAVDYKAPAEHYPQVCGQGGDASSVLETIRLLSEDHVPFEVRTTVIPELGLDELSSMAQEIPVVPRYVLNRYRVPEKYQSKDAERIHQRPYTPEEIRTFAKKVTQWQPNAVY